MSLLLILAGLALAVIAAAIYAGNIRDRFWLQVSCAGFGAVVAGICGLSDLMVGLPAAIAGLMAWGASAWASCRTFPVGQASVYQPAFFRDPNSPLNLAEWLIMMPGFRMFREFFCKLVATLEIGRLAFEHDVEVRLGNEGLATVTIRVDAELPLDRPDLLGRFVQSVPSGTALTDAPARTAYIKERLVALAKQVLEACAEQLSAYTADSLELQAIAEGNNPNRFDYMQNLAYVAQELLGLPAEGWDENGNLVRRIRVDVIDIVLGKELQDTLARRTQNDTILEKALEILEAEGKVSPAQYRLVLRQKQIRDAARFNGMSDGEFHDASKGQRVVALQLAFKKMLTVKEFEELLAKDGGAKGKTQIAAEYRQTHAQAESAPAEAEAEELLYRQETIEAENHNMALGDLALAANPTLVKLAGRLERELREYGVVYGKDFKTAVDIAGSGIDTSRISIAGLEGLGGAEGLEALRMLRPVAGKGGKP